MYSTDENIKAIFGQLASHIKNQIYPTKPGYFLSNPNHRLEIYLPKTREIKYQIKNLKISRVEKEVIINAENQSPQTNTNITTPKPKAEHKNYYLNHFSSHFVPGKVYFVIGEEEDSGVNELMEFLKGYHFTPSSTEKSFEEETEKVFSYESFSDISNSIDLSYEEMIKNIGFVDCDNIKHYLTTIFDLEFTLKENLVDLLYSSLSAKKIKSFKRESGENIMKIVRRWLNIKKESKIPLKHKLFETNWKGEEVLDKDFALKAALSIEMVLNKSIIVLNKPFKFLTKFGDKARLIESLFDLAIENRVVIVSCSDPPPITHDELTNLIFLANHQLVLQIDSFMLREFLGKINREKFEEEGGFLRRKQCYNDLDFFWNLIRKDNVYIGKDQTLKKTRAWEERVRSLRFDFSLWRKDILKSDSNECLEEFLGSERPDFVAHLGSLFYPLNKCYLLIFKNFSFLFLSLGLPVVAWAILMVFFMLQIVFVEGSSFSEIRLIASYIYFLQLFVTIIAAYSKIFHFSLLKSTLRLMAFSGKLSVFPLLLVFGMFDSIFYALINAEFCCLMKVSDFVLHRDELLRKNLIFEDENFLNSVLVLGTQFMATSGLFYLLLPWIFRTKTSNLKSGLVTILVFLAFSTPHTVNIEQSGAPFTSLLMKMNPSSLAYTNLFKTRFQKESQWGTHHSSYNWYQNLTYVKSPPKVYQGSGREDEGKSLEGKGTRAEFLNVNKLDCKLNKFNCFNQSSECYVVLKYGHPFCSPWELYKIEIEEEKAHGRRGVGPGNKQRKMSQNEYQALEMSLQMSNIVKIPFTDIEINFEDQLTILITLASIAILSRFLGILGLVVFSDKLGTYRGMRDDEKGVWQKIKPKRIKRADNLENGEVFAQSIQMDAPSSVEMSSNYHESCWIKTQGKNNHSKQASQSYEDEDGTTTERDRFVHTLEKLTKD